MHYGIGCKLTRVLSFEVANEADVFLHPLKSSQLHGVIDHLHWVLQHLGGDIDVDRYFLTAKTQGKAAKLY